ncbi:hypothetical protein PthBH41_29470 [Parageobacillus thermoglucosidasius]|nr:hypothetical protein PthBH41_29470 [Parageobacillus thermoglucosidasius]GAJ42633.1 hypothetical protein GT2_04_01220 [Parageobacillus thermoglucosidasius NBRC 107763]
MTSTPDKTKTYVYFSTISSKKTSNDSHEGAGSAWCGTGGSSNVCLMKKISKS